MADARVTEQQLAAALIEQLRVQDAAGDERGHHLPIARHHAVRRVGVGPRRAQRRPLLEGSDLEIAGEPVPRFAHAIVTSHLVEPKDQIYVVERRFHHRFTRASRYPPFFTTPILTIVSPFFSDGSARMTHTLPASTAAIS